jgi:hypothetical protein
VRLGQAGRREDDHPSTGLVLPEGRAKEPTRLEAFEQAVAAAWPTDRLLATFLKP